MSLRTLLFWLALAGCCSGCKVTFSSGSGPSKQQAERSPSILNVRDFGARGDGIALDTKAIQRAMDSASERGGTVRVPAGDYRSGTLQLRDNVTLFLENGSTLWGSTDIEDYDPEHKHLLYAEGARNIAIVEKVFGAELIIPKFQTFREQIQDIYEECKDNHGNY